HAGGRRGGPEDLSGGRGAARDRGGDGRGGGGRDALRGPGRRDPARPGLGRARADRGGRLFPRSGGGRSGAARALSPGDRVRRAELPERPLGAGPREAPPRGTGPPRLAPPPDLEPRLVPRSRRGAAAGGGNPRASQGIFTPRL